MLYSRSGCHLCEEAARLLLRYRQWLPEPQTVDIDADPRLKAEFDTCVPVVECDGKRRFRGRVDEALLRRLIRATPPRL